MNYEQAKTEASLLETAYRQAQDEVVKAEARKWEVYAQWQSAENLANSLKPLTEKAEALLLDIAAVGGFIEKEEATSRYRTHWLVDGKKVNPATVQALIDRRIISYKERRRAWYLTYTITPEGWSRVASILETENTPESISEALLKKKHPTQPLVT